MISERTNLQISILEHLAAPLVAAVDEVAARTGALGGDAAEKDGAEKVAALLGRSVQTSIVLADGLKLKDSDGDAARVALAGLGARLVAAQYQGSNGKVPGDNETKRVGATLDAILSFADNFAAGAEGRVRLEMLDAGAQPDETQVMLQYVAALIPVINEVAAFSFGRAEKKLVQDVTDRLVNDAADLRRVLLGDSLAPAVARRAELQALRTLAQIYAACHRAETVRLAQMAPADRERIAAAGAGIPMEPVWDAYGMRLTMIHVLGDNLQRIAGGGSRAPQPVQAAPVQQAPAQQTPVQQAPAQQAPVQAGPAGAYVPPDAPGVVSAAEAKSNPMAFFRPGTKKAEGGEG